MKAFFLIGLFVFISVVSVSQTNYDKELHSDGDGWGLKTLQEEGDKIILLIGNSICNGYKSFVNENLAGYRILAWINPYHLLSEHLYSDLEKVLENENIILIHFNIGLHGWPKGRIPKGQYEPNLQKYLDCVRENSKSPKLIWASTTPITSEPRPITLHKEHNPTIVERNEIAKKVMKINGVELNDLYALCLRNIEDASGDKFHWNQKVYKILGEQVAKRINAALNSNN